MLDEIDKMGVDMRGDPAAALLEVLDPEQNVTFQDHYLDLPFDLSQVTFLATANNPETHPRRALMDRMEVIEVPGLHAHREARASRSEFLVPKQLSAHGLTDERLEFTDDGHRDASSTHYTREAGVRGLEREIGVGVPSRRDAARRGRDDVREVADAERRREGPRPAAGTRPSSPSAELARASRRASRGRRAGGDILFIEATQDARQGQRPAHRQPEERDAGVGDDRGLLRAQPRGDLGLDPEFLKTIDLHLHVPKGGTPKDGPSAGVTMFTAVASLLLALPGEAATSR